MIDDPVEVDRVQLFALLGRLLAAPPESGLLRRLAELAPGRAGTGGGTSPLGAALGRLGEAAAAAAAETPRVAREFHDLFIGVGRGEVLPYASWYLTGFLHERPLAALRRDLARLGIARAEGIAEPEDHIAFLCETFAGLLGGALPGGRAEAGRFFATHIAPWAGRLFADLELAETARFYRAVGALGRLAVEIETAAAGLPD